MTNGDLRGKIDKLWTDFWTGGITNPLTVIEQITYLFFCRMLDEAETNREKAAQRTGRPFKALWFVKDQQELRWSRFRHKSGEELLALVRDKVFPFLRTLDQPREVNGDNEGAKIGLGALMKNAQLLIVKPGLLSSTISAIDDMEMSSTDAKGDLYEYLLSKLSTAGINGHPPAYTGNHGGTGGTQTLGNHRRPGLRHSGFSGQNHGIPAPDAYFAGYGL